MAKVLIYPSNVVPGLSLVITKLGHTPVYKDRSLITPSAIIAEGPPGADGVLMILFTVVDSSESVKQSIRILNEMGYIFSVGRTNTSSSSLSSVLYTLDLASTAGFLTSTDMFFRQNSEFLSQTTKDRVSIYMSNGMIIEGFAEYGGNLLIHDSLERAAALHYEPNSLASDGFLYQHPLFYIGFLWDLPADENSQTILVDFFRDVFDYCIEYHKPNLIIEGSVKDLTENGLVRDLAIYSTETNRLIASVKSDTSGYYQVLLKDPSPVFIVLIPFGFEKPEIHYGVVPQAMSS